MWDLGTSHYLCRGGWGGDRGGQDFFINVFDTYNTVFFKIVLTSIVMTICSLNGGWGKAKETFRRINVLVLFDFGAQRQKEGKIIFQNLLMVAANSRIWLV